MPEFDTELLATDKKLIILEQACSLYNDQKNPITRAQLFNACNKRIKVLKTGLTYGGQFQDHLKEFQGDETTAEQDKLLKITSNPMKEGSRKNRTLITPIIDNIESYIAKRRLGQSSDSLEYKDLTAATYLDSTLWENEWKRVIKYQIKRDTSFSTLLKLKTRKDHEFMVNAVADIESHTRPSRWRVSMLYPGGKEFHFDNDAMKLLNNFLEIYLSRNTFPFKFIIEYLGPFDDHEWFHGVMHEKSVDKELKHFVEWASSRHNHAINETDKETIRKFLLAPPDALKERLVDHVGIETVELLARFQKQLVDYIRIVLKSNSLAPFSYR